MRLNYSVTKKQKAFMDATEAEVLFGGAAGGGKSYGQVVDALLFALKYPASKQLILRRTFAELDKSLIRSSLSLYPREIYSFNSSTHTGRFRNGSVIDFGYCAAENDVYQYQSAEYDVIRFDELTHFTESQYVYLISRVRGANSYPKRKKLYGALVSLIPSTVCMVFTISVILTAKDDLTVSTVIDGLVKLAALPIIGLKGMLDGFKFAAEDRSGWLETKARLLSGFCAEK